MTLQLLVPAPEKAATWEYTKVKTIAEEYPAIEDARSMGLSMLRARAAIEFRLLDADGEEVEHWILDKRRQTAQVR